MYAIKEDRSMKKSFFLLSFILPFSIYTSSLSADQGGGAEYESEINLVPEQCIQLMSSNRAGGSTWSMRFYNVCGESVYANACIEESPGKFKLYKSGSRIPQNGYWNLYSYSGHQPLSISIASGRGMPGIPGQCGIEKKH